MIGEVDIFGVFIPALLVLMLLAYAVNKILAWLLNRFGFYRLFWHRSIVELALYVIVLGLIVFITQPILT